MEKMSRKEKERLLRREYVLAAAERSFASKGYIKTTMADLAKESEFALATLYQFFKSKEEIYFTLINEKVDRLFSLQQAAIAGVKSATEKIRSLIKITLEYFDENRDFFRIYISERSGVEVTVKDDLGEKINEKYNQYIDLITNIVEEGIEKEEFKELNPREMALAVIGGCNALIYQWIITNHEESLASKLDNLMEILFRGIKK